MPGPNPRAAVAVLTVENFFTPISENCEESIDKRREGSKFPWHPYCAIRGQKPSNGAFHDNCRESGFTVPRAS